MLHLPPFNPANCGSFFVTCLLFLASCNSNPESEESSVSKWKELKKEAINAYFNSDFEKSIRCLDSAAFIIKEINDSLYFATLGGKTHVITNMRNFELAELTAKETFDLAKKNGNSIYIGNALNELGNLYAKQSEIKKAKEYYERYIDLSVKINYKSGEALARNNIATCYEQEGYLSEALEEYNKSILIYENLKNEIGLARNYGNVAILYSQRGNINDLEKAIGYEKKSISLRKKQNDFKSLVESQNRLGTYFLKSNNLDSAEISFFKALNLADSIAYEEYLPSILTNIGSVKLLKKELSDAFKYSNKAEIGHQKTGSIREKIENQIILSNIAISENDISRAGEILNNLTSLNEGLEMPDLTIKILEAKVEFLKKRGAYKEAEQVHREIRKVEKEAIQKERIASFEREKVRANLSKVEKELLESQKENITKNSHIKLLIASIIAAILLILFLRITLKNAKNEKELLERDTEEMLKNRDAKIELLEKEQLTLEKLEELGSIPKDFRLKGGGNITLLEKDIQHIKWRNNYATLNVVDGNIYEVRGSTADFEKIMNPYLFVQVHRSYFVNRLHITLRQLEWIFMGNPKRSIPVGKKFRDKKISFEELISD